MSRAKSPDAARADAADHRLAVFEADDGRVIGLHRNVGERDGKQLDTMCCIVVELQDGQIKSGTEFFFDLHNWDQFWS